MRQALHKSSCLQMLCPAGDVSASQGPKPAPSPASPPGRGVLSGASLPAQRSQSSQFFSKSLGSPAKAGSCARGTSAAHCASLIQRASSSLRGGTGAARGHRTCGEGGAAPREGQGLFGSKACVTQA